MDIQMVTKLAIAICTLVGFIVFSIVCGRSILNSAYDKQLPRSNDEKRKEPIETPNIDKNDPDYKS